MNHRWGQFFMTQWGQFRMAFDTCWTRRGSTVRERYAVAQSASEQAVATLRRILVGRRGLRFAVM
ncbi:MAG TPA: hypothetical protein VFA72_19305, partial [Burkholderiales bacterium]|nr:hypothetical protein [Burkholderiales bacterium]